MSALLDNMIAYKVIKMLVTPFAATDAYKYGIIDAHGNVLRKSNTLTTTLEREAYNYLTRLVFNVKKLLAKLPNNQSKLQSMAGALFLVKECYDNNIKTTSLMEARFNKILEHMNNGVVLVEEEIAITQYLKTLSEEGVGGGVGAALSAAPANIAGEKVSTDVPKLLNNKVKKYKEINRRTAPVK
jgi:hypothetical protein